MRWSEVTNMGCRAVYSWPEAYAFLGIATFTEAPSSRFRNWFHGRNLSSPLAITTIPQIVEENDLFINSCDKVKLRVWWTEEAVKHDAQWHEHEWFGTVCWSNNEKLLTSTSSFGESVHHLPGKRNGVNVVLGEHFKYCGQPSLCAWCMCFWMHIALWG